MKKELQKKMSSQSLNKQLIYGLIKKDNVLVIEKKNSLDQVLLLLLCLRICAQTILGALHSFFNHGTQVYSVS